MSTLTPRERQICLLMEKQPGLTNNSIGCHIGISPNTVKVYLQRVYKKLDVVNRTELVANLCREDHNTFR